VAQKRKATQNEKRLLNHLRGTRYPAARLQDLRQELSGDDQIALARSILQNPYYSERLLSKSFPVSFRELDAPFSPGLDLHADLFWNVARCLAIGSPLRAALSGAVKFDNAFLLGQFDRAETQLAKWQSDFGHSLWSIQARVLLLQHSRGYDGQREYALSLRDADEYRGGPSVVAYFASLRNAPVTTYPKFQKTVDELVDTGKLTPQFKAFLRFHAFHPVTADESFIGYVLSASMRGSAIDCFFAVRFAAIALAVGGAAFDDSTHEALGRLSRLTGDRLLGRFFLGSSEPTDRLVQATESYFEDDFAACAALALQSLTDDPQSADLLLLHALASTADDQSTEAPIIAISQAARRVLTTGDRRGTQASDLLKWCMNLQGSPLSFLAAAVTEIDSVHTRDDAIVGAASASESAHPLWLRWLRSIPGRFTDHLTDAVTCPAIFGPVEA